MTNVKSTDTFTNLKFLVNSLKYISNHYLSSDNKVPVDRLKCTDFVVSIVNLHQNIAVTTDNIDIVTRSGNGDTILVVLDDPEAIPFVDKYQSGDSIGYIVTIPKLLFDVDTNIYTVISILFNILTGYIVNTDPYLSSEFDQYLLINKSAYPTYDVQLMYMALFMLYDIIDAWFDDPNGSSKSIISTLSTVSNDYTNGPMTAKALVPAMASVKKMWDSINSDSDKSYQELVNNLFMDGQFVKFI